MTGGARVGSTDDTASSGPFRKSGSKCLRLLQYVTLCHIMSHYVNPTGTLFVGFLCQTPFVPIIASVPSISFSIFAMPLAVIPNGPYSIVPLVWTLGLLTAAVMVDSVSLADAEHTQSMLSGFYRVKAVDPPVWFLAINLALLLLGLLGNVSSLIAVFTAQCTIKRRFLELVGVLLFVGNVWFNVAILGPLEASVATLPRTVSGELDSIRWQLFQSHCIAIAIVIAVWAQMHIVWASQSSPAVANTVQSDKKNK